MAQRLFIRIKDGEIFEHPIIEANFRAAFPRVNVDNLPPEFAEFIRVPMPNPDEGKRIVSATCTYQWDGNVVKDVWEVVQEDIPPPEEVSGNLDDVAGNTEEPA